jgi:signal transduction histidine kinase
LTELLLFVANFTAEIAGVPQWIPMLAIEGLFTTGCAMNTFVCKDFKQRVPCYAVNFVALFLLALLVSNTYMCAVYILILTEFYISSPRLKDSVAMGAASLLTFEFVYGFILSNASDLWGIIAACFNESMILIVHFLLVNFALNVYDSRQQLKESLNELDESNRKLQRAYNELAEITVLQERQRIAKEIHDTAGHSITTVIMQTEAAKLIVEENPQEAKRKIVAANLQAKNALEELRESVHILAGNTLRGTLKEDLEGIIHDSCDGTDVVIRYDIEDIVCSPAKSRFICNCLKEGISNGLRHGHATAFYFELNKIGDMLSFLLSDNGKGVEMANFKEGYGTTSMRNRAESFGGKVNFSGFLDDGFEIRMELPVDAGK